MKTTLEELRDMINGRDDWDLNFNEIIIRNGWKDNTGEPYGICEDEAGRVLEFDENMNAVII